jgi:hypothetical protein
MMKYMNRRKHLEAEERRGIRNQREAAAGKLLQRAPDLTSLSISIHEARSDGYLDFTQYIRRVVLEHAPALFEVPCSCSSCDGVHDMTREVLLALASRKTRFEGNYVCRGTCSAGNCGRVLRYVATATYRARPSDEPREQAPPMRQEQ